MPEGPEADAALLRFLRSIDVVKFGETSGFEADDVEGANHLHANSGFGSIHLCRGLLSPLDFKTVSAEAIDAELRGVPLRVASLRATVAFKRLSKRGQGEVDIEMLERVHGRLRLDPAPDLDA